MPPKKSTLKMFKLSLTHAVKYVGGQNQSLGLKVHVNIQFQCLYLHHSLGDPQHTHISPPTHPLTTAPVDGNTNLCFVSLLPTLSVCPT